MYTGQGAIMSWLDMPIDKAIPFLFVVGYILFFTAVGLVIYSLYTEVNHNSLCEAANPGKYITKILPEKNGKIICCWFDEDDYDSRMMGELCGEVDVP